MLWWKKRACFCRLPPWNSALLPCSPCTYLYSIMRLQRCTCCFPCCDALLFAGRDWEKFSEICWISWEWTFGGVLQLWLYATGFFLHSLQYGVWVARSFALSWILTPGFLAGTNLAFDHCQALSKRLFVWIGSIPETAVHLCWFCCEHRPKEVDSSCYP